MVISVSTAAVAQDQTPPAEEPAAEETTTPEGGATDGATTEETGTPGAPPAAEVAPSPANPTSVAALPEGQSGEITNIPEGATLKVLSGIATDALKVTLNRALIVESAVPFAELSIANPSIADISTLSDRTLYVLGRAPGRTTLTLLSPEGRLITNVEIHVSPDVAEFKERLEQIIPGENISVRTANDGIVLSGVVSSIERLDRALDLANRYAPGRVSNLMVVGGTHQVMLKVRFAEMSRSVSKGINGGIAGSYASGSGNTVADIGLGSGELIEDEPPVLFLDSASIGQVGIGQVFGNLAIGVLLEALENKGLVRTLAEPNLTTLSGQKASFLAGGEYPIPLNDGEGGISVEYKKFGVELTFTPRVVNENKINISLLAAVSGIDDSINVGDGSFSFSGFRRRESSTTVELGDGESFVIAGLIEDDFSDLIGQVPWFGDIPVLGLLLRSTQYQRRQTELVIIVTPHLVHPTKMEAISLPTDRVRAPSEAELFLLGRTAVGRRNGQDVITDGAVNGGAAEVAKQDFQGSYGYVME
ncbi:MAG: type II and III secretion system protein family protein [Rhodobacteraceae bacterium]|nr:type II and III secretion system protein family protein [Paracoccaceae bacterium]